MTQVTNSKPEALDNRTYRFAVDVKVFIKQLPRSLSNTEYAKQLIRSSGSVAANYIEANESLSRKDFVMRCRISRKEVKESRLWLKLVDPSETQEAERSRLLQESTELLKILSAIIEKST
ncbi:four helix bundle protein [Candidatus Saccharibacteria bacterium]|nr:MAG: four helix bundle protein [Candidatus Saccharibacteria bacterium]